MIYCRFNNYYVILPSTSIWDIEKFRKTSSKKVGKFCDENFEYSSEKNSKVLSIKEIKELLKKNL